MASEALAFVADLGEFGGVSPGHRPPDFANRAISAEQMFGHQPAGKAGRAIDDEVVGARKRLFDIGHVPSFIVAGDCYARP